MPLTEEELKQALEKAKAEGDMKLARQIAEQIVMGEKQKETAFSEAARRQTEVQGSIADRERMRPQERQGVTEFGTPEDFAAGAARTAEFFAKMPGFLMQRKPPRESAGPLEQTFRQEERPLLAEPAAELLAPQNVEAGFEKLGIQTEGGEDTFMGRSGEFVTGGYIGGINNAIRAAKAAGLIGFTKSTARNVGASELAAVGSEIGGNFFERNGLPPILGELSGALAPNFLLRITNRTITGASQTQRAENSVAAREAKRDAEALDVALSAGIASPNSRVSFFERALASIPGGTRALHDFASRTHKQIEQSLGRITAPFRGDPGREAAGIGIATALNRRIDNFKKAGDRLYRNAEALIPANQPVPVTGFRSALDDIVGGTPEKVEDLVGAIRAGRKQIAPKVAKALDKLEAGDTLTFEEANAVRRVIGHEINNSSLIGDAPIGELKKLYGALSDDIANSLTGEMQISAWRGANEFWKRGRQEVDDFYAPLLKNNSKPEKLFDAVFASKGGNISTVRRVWKTMGPAERELASKAFIAKLGKVAQSETGEIIQTPSFKMRTFITSWDNPELQATKDVILSGQPGLRKNLDVFVRHIRRVLDNNEAYDNPSGSGVTGLAAATAYYALAGMTGAGAGLLFGDEGATDAAKGAAVGVGGLLVASKATRSAALLMTHEPFVNWLARGTRVPINKTPEYFGQLAVIANRSEPYIQEAIADFANEYSAMFDPGLLTNEDFQGRPIEE